MDLNNISLDNMSGGNVDLAKTSTETDKGIQSNNADTNSNGTNVNNDAASNVPPKDINEGGADTNNAPIEESSTPEPEVSNKDKVTSFLSGDEKSIDKSTLEERNKLYEIYDVKGHDINGNLINSKGNVVLFYSDVEKFVISGTLPVNNNGTILDSFGNEVATIEQSTLVNDTNELIKNEFGFEISNIEEINSIEDEKERERILYKTLVIDSQNQGITLFLENNPAIKDYYNHIRLGGSPTDYNGKGIDYSNVDIKQLGVSDKINIIKDLYKLKNLPIQDSYLKFVEKDENALNAVTADAVAELDKYYKEKSKKEEAFINEQNAKAREENIKYWEGIREVVSKGKLLDVFNIPDKDKDSFFRYLSAPINNDGQSQDMVDEDEVTTEERLILSYLRFKKKTLKDLMDSTFNNYNTKQRQSILNRYKPKVVNNGTTSNSSVNFKGISMDNIKI